MDEVYRADRSQIDDPPSADDLRSLLADRPRFISFVKGRVGSLSLAEDIVQESFAKAIKQETTLRDGASATAWFYRILRNEIVDQARRAQANARKAEHLGQQAVEDSVDPRAFRTPCRCVLSVLSTLRSDHAGLIEAVDLDEVPVSQAAVLFGITANNASVRLHRARAALREGLAARCGKCSLEGCGDCSCRESAESSRST